ncbi:MAG: ornithine carbamoyltransferase [Gaiellaceae bacterium]
MTLVAPPIPKNLLEIGDLERASVEKLLDLAVTMKARPHGFIEALRGDTLVCYFEKPSTRTRVSFAAAAERLGMLPLLLGPDELQLGRGETIEDTARTLAGYASAIVVRTFAQDTVRRIADASTVPVINALTDEHHPCQALADLLTLRERFGRLEGLRVAYIGDGNNVARSLLEASALVGIEAVAACPPGYEPSVEGATVISDPLEAAAGAHAVYTDVWVSMGDEEREVRLAALAPFQVDAHLLGVARPDAVFMHCLPAHRGEEVTADVIDGTQSVVWLQAENRLPTEEALLLALVTQRWEA